MLVSTLLLALLAAFTIYYEHEVTMGLAMFWRDMERRKALVNEVLNINHLIIEMDETEDPPEGFWVPLMLGQNLTSTDDITSESSEGASYGLYGLATGVALCSLLLVKQYFTRPQPIRRNRHLHPPHRSPHHHTPSHHSHPRQSPSRHSSPNHTLQQPSQRREWDIFAEFERLQQRDFSELIEEIEQFPRRPRHHRHHHLRPHHSSSRHPSPAPPYSRLPPSLPPPPPYRPPNSPPPPYSQLDPHPSPD